MDWCYLEVNPGFVKQSGWSDAPGRRISELLPGIEQEWLDFYGSVASTGAPGRLEGEAKALESWYDVCAFKVGGPETRTVGVLAYDVTARNKAEADSRADKQMYRDIFSSIDQGFLVLEVAYDSEGCLADLLCREANAAARRLLGVDVTGLSARQTVPGHLDSWRRMGADLLRSGESLHFRQSGFDGSQWFECHAFRLGGADSRRVAAIFSDVTEDVRNEADLRFIADVDRLLSGASPPRSFRGWGRCWASTWGWTTSSSPRPRRSATAPARSARGGTNAL